MLLAGRPPLVGNSQSVSKCGRVCVLFVILNIGFTYRVETLFVYPPTLYWTILRPLYYRRLPREEYSPSFFYVFIVDSCHGRHNSLHYYSYVNKDDNYDFPFRSQKPKQALLDKCFVNERDNSQLADHHKYFGCSSTRIRRYSFTFKKV